MQSLRQLLAGKKPWVFLVVFSGALVIQMNPAWRAGLIYDRGMVGQGEIWRVWTGHLVHFGWGHFVADAGLLFILGWLLESKYPLFSWLALALMPAFISATLYWLDPDMVRYGGLSAVNLGMLLYLAAQGWQRNWTDWFWPAVLAIYVGEVIFEAVQGGRGGGMIRFDDPGIRVATSAHLASAAYALAAWLCSGIWLSAAAQRARGRLPAETSAPELDRRPS
jgi:rhomboid family GlyGly-CTERM serine protease